MSNPWLSPTTIDESAQTSGQQGSYQPPANPWTNQADQGMWGTQQPAQQQAVQQSGPSSGYNPMYSERNPSTEGAAAGDAQGKPKSSGGLMGAMDNPAINFATSVGGALATTAVSGAGLTAATVGASLVTGVATFGIGIIAGAILGKIFGGKEKVPKLTLASGDWGMQANAYEDGYMVKSRLATIGLSDGGSKYVDARDPKVQELVEGIAGLDNVIADYIGQPGIDAITKTMMQENPKRDGSPYGWQATEINDRTLRDRYWQMLGHASTASPQAKNALDLVAGFEKELFKIVRGGTGGGAAGVKERIAELVGQGAVAGESRGKGIISAIRKNFDTVGGVGGSVSRNQAMTPEKAKDMLFGSGGDGNGGVVLANEKVTPESLEDEWVQYYESNGGKPPISKDLFMKYVPKYRQQMADYNSAQASNKMTQNDIDQWKAQYGGQPPENYEGIGMVGHGYSVNGQIRTESDMYQAQQKLSKKSAALKDKPRGVALDLEDFVPVMLAGLQGYTLDDIRNGRGSPSSPYTPGSGNFENSVGTAASDASSESSIGTAATGSNYLDYMRSIAPKSDLEAAAAEKNNAERTVLTRHETTPTISFYQGYMETIAEQDATKYAPNEGIEGTYTITNQKHKPEPTRSYYQDYVNRTKQTRGGLQ